MTVRETFERVRTHLLTQGRRAEAPGLGCAYRAQDPTGRTTSCAVGCLVPDELYDPAMERSGIISLETHGGRWVPTMEATSQSLVALAAVLNASGVPATPEHRRLLKELQRIHDFRDPAEWEESLSLLSLAIGEDDRGSR